MRVRRSDVMMNRIKLAWILKEGICVACMYIPCESSVGHSSISVTALEF